MWHPNEQLDYVGPIVRPPSEASSIILQVTVGCAHNKCTFCTTFKDKNFYIKPWEVVLEDLEKAARLYPNSKRLFIADGDALVMPMSYWERLLLAIREKLPGVLRAGVYATGFAIGKKSDEELRWLNENGLGIVYLGLESGDDETLKYIKKDSYSEKMIRGARRVIEAGMKLSVTVLLGIAPKGRRLAHAEATGRALTAMSPDYVGALSVMVCEGTELAGQVAEGSHRVGEPTELLEELKVMLEHTEMDHGLFMANHASNYLPIRVRMPKEKQRTLALLDEAIAGGVKLKPEIFRAL